MGWWYATLAPWIALGYRSPASGDADVRWIEQTPVPAGSLVAFCPTMVLPDNETPQRETILELHRQLADGVRGGRLPPTVLVLSYLDVSGDDREAVERVGRIRADADTDAVPVAAFRTRTRGKINALNVALREARTAGACAFLQVDDDIRLDPDAVDELYAVYRAAGRPLAVGATKIGIPRAGGASRMMRWGKRHTRSAEDFPHACCMVVHPDLLPDGIPPRYLSDDRYICFTLLRPAEPDPMADLRLAPSARCRYLIGGPAPQAAGRIRRILLSTHVLMAEFPQDVSRYYFREIMFPRFVPLGASRGTVSARAWLVQAAYFTWFMAVAVELVLRGRFARPLRRLEYRPVRDRSLPPPPTSGGSS